MGLAITFHSDAGKSGERATSRLEFAAAFSIVIALHAALAVWVLRSHERPVLMPEPPRTIVARLLSTAPAAPLRAMATPAPEIAPPHPAPPHAVAPPRPVPPARVKPPVVSRPAPRETTPLARETPRPAPSVAPSTPDSSAHAATTPQAVPTTDTTQPSPAAQSSAANAPPKNVSHVDCNIAQPDYPEISRRRAESGTAVVRFVVGMDGRVESAAIQQSSGYARLDDAALDVVRGGSCRPWKEAGVAVRVAYTQPFVFGLGN